jgi:linoleoyl-CoA desaturase
VPGRDPARFSAERTPACYSRRTLIRRKPSFASPAVLKPALDRRVHAFLGGRKVVDSPLMYAKAALLVALAASTYYWLVFVAASTAAVLTAGLLLALALGGIGFNIQHDGNHGTFSRHAWINRLAGFTLDLIGASSYFWKDKHNHNHHVFTNIPHEDADINLGPMARLSTDQSWFWWHRYQHFYLWILYLFVHLRYLYSDVQRLAFGKNDGLSARYPRGADLAWLLGGKAFFLAMAFAVPLSRHAPGTVVATYVLVSMTMGLVFSVVFQLAHTVDVVEHPTSEDALARPEWVVHQIETTANFSTGSRVATFLLGGLNHQREHHLFPHVAHVHYPALAGIVRDVCAEHGVACRENRSLLDALRSHYRFVRAMGVEPAATARR